MNPRPEQTGIVLAQSLVFVLILTFIALAAVRNATLQQRISGNLSTAQQSFQLLESCMAQRLTTGLAAACSNSGTCTADTVEYTCIDGIQFRGCHLLPAPTEATPHPQCCIISSTTFREDTSVHINLNQRNIEINSINCPDPENLIPDNANAPIHRVGFTAISP